MAAATETLEGFEQSEALERISVALAVGAKVAGRAVLWCVKAALMVLCLVPAALVNHEMARGESTAWLAYAVVAWHSQRRAGYERASAQAKKAGKC